MKKYLIALLLLLGTVSVLFSCTPEPESVSLTFLVDGEVYVESVHYTQESAPAPKTDPVKEGYTFNGWYYDKDEWKQIFSPDVFKHEFLPGEYKLYARFEPYTFTLNADKVSYTLTGALPTATGDLKIPSRYLDKPVTAIAPDVFKGNTAITSIVIPDSIVSIGNSAFDCCSSLTSITLPSGLKNLGSDAFARCTSLTSAVLGASLQKIPASAFEGCTALKSVTFPRTVTVIGGRAFFGCSSLEEITLYNMSLENILDSAFEGCSSLASFAVPYTVKTVGSRAFAGASSLAAVTFAENAKLYSIGANAFDGTALTALDLPTSLGALYGNALVGIPAVTYRGTVEAFALITKLDGWNNGVTSPIVCADGSVTP